jgi:glutamate/tyrosine decarboxylase-like PLP-dependent enzyme
MERIAALEMDPEQFRQLGYSTVDKIARFLAGVRAVRVTSGLSPAQIRARLGDACLPERGAAPEALIEEIWPLLMELSLFNGHPRFLGYVTPSAAPLGALGDLIAAAVNPNVGAWALSPIGTEIEAQTVRWIAEFLGYPLPCGGLLVSGGNMANFVGILAARRAKAGWDVRVEGNAGGKRLVAYASSETHTWLQKAADLFGLGTQSIRWIPADRDFRMDVDELRRAIEADRLAGYRPFVVVGSAGTVSTGAVDPLPALAEVAREYDLWFHVDGAYGAPAVALPDAGDDLRGLRYADSVAVDPHKWFYAPLEAGCTLVRDGRHLRDTFDYSPAYYHFDGDGEEQPVNFYSLGPQNSRGFRALKVWLGLRAAGREGLARMIADDIALSRLLYREVEKQAELEVFTQGLSITTFRYVPRGLDRSEPQLADYLNQLNEKLLNRIQTSGEAFLSNAVIGGKFVLRACIVNFRTERADIEALPEIVVRLGREIEAGRKSSGRRGSRQSPVVSPDTGSGRIE